MFLPKTDKDKTKEDETDKRRKEAYVNIEEWSKEAIPKDIRSDVTISVQEVQCGDPDCAPIDTAVAIMFTSGGRGMMGLPMEAYEVKKELLLEGFPTEEVLRKWDKGEEADWPPLDFDGSDHEEDTPELRFKIGQKVECRVGPDPEKGWAKGKVSKLWYREASWPPDAWAPYQIQLDDGKEIFAPGDIDQIIRAAT